MTTLSDTHIQSLSSNAWTHTKALAPDLQRLGDDPLGQHDPHVLVGRIETHAVPLPTGELEPNVILAIQNLVVAKMAAKLLDIMLLCQCPVAAAATR